MPAAKPKNKPSITTDYASRYQAFEDLVLERLAGGKKPLECLTTDENFAIRSQLNLSSMELDRELARLGRVFVSRQIAGTSADRQAASELFEKQQADFAEVEQALEAEKAKIEKQLRQGRDQIASLQTRCQQAEAAADELRRSVPPHIKRKHQSRIDEIESTVGDELRSAEIDAQQLRVMLNGPTADDLNSVALWHGTLQRFDIQFVSLQPNGVYRTTPKWDEAQPALQKRLESLETEIDQLRAAKESQMAEAASLLGHYIV